MSVLVFEPRRLSHNSGKYIPKFPNDTFNTTAESGFRKRRAIPVKRILLSAPNCHLVIRTIFVDGSSIHANAIETKNASSDCDFFCLPIYRGNL